jgi:hypothetical protein
MNKGSNTLFDEFAFAGRDKLILTGPSPLPGRGERGLVMKIGKESLPV